MAVIVRWLALVFAGWLSMVWAAEDAAAPEWVTLRLDGPHRFQYAGFYAAIAQGYYRAHGFEVALRPAEHGVEPRAEVLAGRADYAIGDGSVVAWRLEGQPLVILAHYFKEPVAVLLSQAGLHSVAELRERRLMATGAELQAPLLHLSLRAAGLVPGENLTIIPHRFDSGALIRREVEAMTAARGSDSYDLVSKGVPFQVIELSTAVPGLGDGYLFTSEHELSAHPERVAAFFMASNAGWRYALEHVDELIELIRQRYAPEKSAAALRYEADIITALLYGNVIPLGAVSEARLELAARMLLEAGYPGTRQRLEGFVHPLALVSDRTKVPLDAAEQRWLASHPEIVIGIDRRWAPAVKLLDDGRMVGIEPELLALIGAATGARLRLEPGDWADLVARAERGDIHGLAAAAAHPERAARFLFTDSPYSVSFAIFIRKDHPHPPLRMEDLAGRKIGFTRGNLTEQKLLARWPEITAVADDPESLIAQLLAGQLDGVISSLHFGTMMYKLTPEIRLALLVPDSETPLRYAIGRAYPELHRIIDKVLTAHAAAVQTITQRWLHESGALTATLELTPAEREWRARHPEVIFQADNNFAPYSFVNADGEMDGIAIELVRALAAAAGLRVRILPATFQEMVAVQPPPGVWGYIQFDSDLSHAPERFLRIESPLASAQALFVAHPERFTAPSVTQLQGKRILFYEGIDPTAFGFPATGNEYSYTSDPVVAFEQVLNDRVDGYFDNIAYIQWHLRKQFITALTPLYVTNRFPDPLLAVFAEAPELHSLLLKAYRQVAPRVPELLERWQLPLLETPQLALSDEQRAWLRAHPVIRYAVHPDYRPIAWQDARGQPAGMTVDYLRYLASVLGVRFEPVTVNDWRAALHQFNQGTIDLLPAVPLSASRAPALRLTAPYLDFPVALFAPVTAPLTGDLRALAGQTVAMVADRGLSEWLRQDHPDLNLLPLADLDSALAAVVEGRAAALLDNLLVANQALLRRGDTQLRMIGTTPYTIKLSMAVRPDWAPLAEILDQALVAMPQHERDVIDHRWLRESAPPPDYRLLWGIGGAAAALLALIVLWNRTLAREIARRHAVERALRAAHDEIHTLIEESPLAMLISVGPDERVVLLNRQFRERIGYSRAEVPDVAHWWPLAYPDPDYRQAIQQEWARNMARARVTGGPVGPVEARVRCRDGQTRVFAVQATTVNERHLVVFVELTEQRATEERLEQARVQAEQANHAKSTFLATMSHEIRTPLNAVLGMLYLCLETPLDARQRDYLEKAQRAAQTLLGLLNDLLDLAKIEAGRLSLEQISFAPCDSLAHLRVIFADQAQAKGLALRLHCAPAVPALVRGDPARLNQVLLNLVSNALKFTERGSVQVTIDCLEHTGEQVRLRFAVADTGIGIAPDQLAELFQPFQQADPSITRRYGGSGLGLAICQRLVTMMGGTIGVDSTPGQGSKFHFVLTFPVQNPQAHSDGDETAAGAARLTDAAPAPAASADLEHKLPLQTMPEAAGPGSDPALTALLHEIHMKALLHDPLIEDLLREQRPLLAAGLTARDCAALVEHAAHYRFERIVALLEHLLAAPPQR